MIMRDRKPKAVAAVADAAALRTVLAALLTSAALAGIMLAVLALNIP